MSDFMSGDDGIDKYDEGGVKYLLLRVGGTMDPYEFKVIKAPDDWIEISTNTEEVGYTFYHMDNPVVYSSFSCRPVFVSISQGGQ